MPAPRWFVGLPRLVDWHCVALGCAALAAWCALLVTLAASVLAA